MSSTSQIAGSENGSRGRLPVSSAAACAISVRGLAKTYRCGVEAVKGIDFEVTPGEVFGLLGPNGAGKSTTIGMLTTTIAPTAGTACLGGFDVVKNPIAARSVSSVVFQDSVVDKALTGRRNLDLHARLWGVPQPAAARKITELAGVFGLSEVMSRPVDSYSGGHARAAGDAAAVGPPSTSPLGSSSATDTIPAIQGLGIDTAAMTTRKPTLDDVYLQLTGSRLAA